MTFTFKPLRNGIIASTVVSMGLAGCATPGGMNSPNANTGGSSECNVAGMAAIGAVVGGLLSRTNNGNGLKGAAIGGALASLACVAYNYHVKQVKTAQQVQEDYKSAHRGRLPQAAQVVHYDTAFSPNNRATPGGSLTLTSNIEVVQGSQDAKAPVIEDELVLFSPDGRELSRKRKVANDGAGAGAYATSHTIKMPEGVPQGEYPVKTALYVNGQKVKENPMSMQIVREGDQQQVALLTR